jgi:hypothetical protein
MQIAQAHAMRRAGFVAAGLVATLVAHASAMGGGGLALLPIAPFLWCGLIAIAVVCGPRACAYAPRSVAGTFAMLVASQVVLHVIASRAPWSLGIASPHMQMSAASMLSARELAPHVAAALLLGMLLVFADRAIARALAIVRQIVGDQRPRPIWPRPARRAPLRTTTLRAQTDLEAYGARGPPDGVAIALIKATATR